MAQNPLLDRIKQIVKPAAQNVFQAAQQASSNVNTFMNTPLVQGRPSINQAIRMTAPTVAQDFGNLFRETTKNVPILRTAGQMIGNTAQQVGSGVVNTVSGVHDVLSGKPIQGGFQALKGVGQIATAATPLSTVTNIASNIGPMQTRRLATGALRGMSMVDTLSPTTQENKWVDIPFIGKIDPLMASGQMLGFTQNALNKKIYNLTNKYIPTQYGGVAKWLTTTGVRGGVENLIQTLDQMPTDKNKQFEFLANTIGMGALMEIGGQGMNEAGKAVLNTRAARAGAAKLTQFHKYMTEGVLDPTFSDIEGGFTKYTEVPRWKSLVTRMNKELTERMPIGGTIKPLTKAEHDAFMGAKGSFEKPYTRGDITKIQNNIDELLGTKSFNMTGKWQNDLPARQTAKDQLIFDAEKGNEEAQRILASVDFLEGQLDVAREAKNIIEPNVAQKVAQEMTGNKNLKVKMSKQKVEVPTQKPLALPMGERVRYEVSTTNQMKKILARDPNANVRVVLKPGKKQINLPGSEVPTREDVAITLPNRLNNFIEDTLGYSTKAPEGGTRGANAWTTTLRKGQEKVTRAVEAGLSSQNDIVRGAASIMEGFFRGLGMSPERGVASSQLRGEVSSAQDQAFNVMTELYRSLGNNKESLERINSVLDPGIAKTKVSINDLTDTEKQVYKLIREGFDLVHDTSYANGHVSVETYIKNKGTYTPRMYEVMEMPDELNQFIRGTKKIDNTLYKQRKDIDQWKIDNALRDPVYALGKRLAQVQTNMAVKKYTDFLASNPNYISDMPKAGFTKLSDSPAYGALSGKYVLNSAAEDLKGFFFSNQAMNTLYDVFKMYDKLPVRQLQKKLLTVFNPTTNVGNIVSDQVFGFLTGVDPLTLNKNLIGFKKNPSEFKQLTNYLMKQGIISTDITKTDFVDRMGKIDDLALGKQEGKIKTIANKVQSFYGGTDDVYKTSAFKALLDKGFSLEEATRRVSEGFQNYANVGKFYDVWSKTPVVGSTFIKFQGDLMRIIKNAATNNPLGLVSFLGALWGVARLSSKLSGESDADRETRENRFAAPMIPGLNIPLTWQTPIGEINAARYISPFYANNETTNLSKMVPFAPNIDPNKDVASNIAMNVNDPMLSPLVQLAVNRDFRGKPIADTKETKFSPSTLTPEEKLANQAKFGVRAYLPPTVNSLIDVGSAAAGEKNMYGATQTIPQALARVAGVKISQMGPEQVQEIRNKEVEYAQKDKEYIQKQISNVTKQQLKGEITPEQASNRIANLQKGMTKSTTSFDNKIIQVGGKFNYIDANGNQQSESTRREAEIGVEKANFTNSSDSFKDLGDVVLRKSDNGNVSVMTKDAYDSALNSAKLTSYKKNDDIKNWFTTAEKQLEVLQRQLLDPKVDELDKTAIQNKIDTLIDQYKDYLSYGGRFTKPKKGKTPPKLQPIKFKAPAKLKVSAKKKKSRIKLQSSKPIAPPKINILKVKRT